MKAYGCSAPTGFFSGRRKVKDLTGNYKVPTLVLDDGTVIHDSKNIIAWAAAEFELATSSADSTTRTAVAPYNRAPKPSSSLPKLAANHPTNT